MARPRRIVAQRFRRPAPDEDGACRADPLDQLLGFLRLDRQVFGAIEVRHLARLGHVAHADGACLGQRRAGDGGAGQALHLTLDLGDDLAQGRAAVGDEDDLRIGVMLGLTEQVGGGDLEIGVAVGDDQQFRRPRRKVLRRAGG